MDCEQRREEVAAYDVRADLSAQAVGGDSFDANVPQLAWQELGTHAAFAPDGEFQAVPHPSSSAAWPVAPGTRVRVTLSADASSGDGDLHVRFGASPTEDQYDCRPYDYGSEETCELIVPTGVTALYVGVHAYDGYGDLDYLVAVEQIIDTVEVTQLVVTPGQQVTLRATLEVGAAALQVRAGAASAPLCDAEGAPGVPARCSFRVPEGAGDLRLFVRALEVPLVVEGTYDVRESSVETLLTLAPRAGEELSIELSAPFDVQAYVAPALPSGAPASWQPVACEGADPLRCLWRVPTDVPPGTALRVGVGSAESEGRVIGRIVHERIGCDEVFAQWNGSRSDGNGLLRAGRSYLVTLGDAGSRTSFDWTEEAPRIWRGAPRESAYFEVLGTAPGASVLPSGDVLVPRIDAAAPRCRLQLDVIPRVRYRHPSLGGGFVAAVRAEQQPDGSEASDVRLAALEEATRFPESPLRVIADLGTSRRALATAVDDARARWVSTDPDGSRARVESLRVALPAEPPLRCAGPSAELALDASFRVHLAAFSEGRLALAGNEGGLEQVQIFERRERAGACPAFARVRRVPLSAPPTALALAG